MRKNNMYPQLFTILGLTASLLLGSGHQALASNTNQPQMESLTKEIEFQTTDKDEDASKYFISSITENDKIFHIADISTEIVNTQTTEAEYAIYDSPAFIDETMVEKPKDTIERDGITYQLKSTEKISKRIEERIQHVEAEIEIKDLEWLDEVPRTREIDITDNSTGQLITAEMPLIKIKTDTEKWVDTFTFPITITDYDADYFMLGNSKVSKADSLLDYKDEFLDYLGLPSDKYKISSIEWNGEPYSKNGIEYRSATAYGQKLIHDVVAVYGGEATMPAADGMYYHCTYINPDKPGGSLYTIKATATYTYSVVDSSGNNFIENLMEWLKANPIAAFGIGTVIIIGFILIILLILSNKKKKEEKEKIEIVDIDKNKEG